MTNEQIQADIERGIVIKREIATLKAELKDIETRLESAGLRGPHIPLEDAEREGKQAILTSLKHRLAVRLESDVLVGGFEVGSTLAGLVKSLISEQAFNALFKVVHKYERKEDDGHKFRIKAKAAIGDQDKYLQFITAIRSKDKDGIAKSKTVICWDNVTTVEPVS